MTKTKSKTISLVMASIFAVLALLFGLSGLWYSPAKGAWGNAMTIQQLTIPYWENAAGDETIIYNEIVTPIRYGSSADAIGYLTYTPTEIISVKNYTLETTYSPSQYTISGNKISFAYNNGMPYMQDSWLDNKDVPEQYQDQILEFQYSDGGGTNSGAHIVAEGSLTRTNFLYVTYKYNSATEDLGFTAPTLQKQNFPNLLKKLESGQPIKMLVFGDSICVGASASGWLGIEPNIPAFYDQIKNYLALTYYGGDTSKITIVNPSVGGKSSPWGVQQATSGAFDKSGYDFVLLGFGMNDGTWNNDPAIFKSNMVTILSEIRAQSPNADFVMIGSLAPNPYSAQTGCQGDYMASLQEIADDFNDIDDELQSKSGCTFVNMYEITNGIFQKKIANNTNDPRYQYMDISANYLSHPNDFVVRLYAGAILSTFIEF